MQTKQNIWKLKDLPGMSLAALGAAGRLLTAFLTTLTISSFLPSAEEATDGPDEKTNGTRPSNLGASFTR